MKKGQCFGTSLKGQLESCFKGQICHACKKIQLAEELETYKLARYLKERGYLLEEYKINFLKQLDGRQVCEDCHLKLLKLEIYYVDKLRRIRGVDRRLGAGKLECAATVEWYWS